MTQKTPTSPPQHPQSYVAMQLYHVLNHTDLSLSDWLTRHPPAPAHKNWAYRCLMGCLRWHVLLSALIELLCTKKPPPRSSLVHCLLVVGLYQLVYMSQSPFASCNETIKACKKLRQHKASGWINACLRQFLRHQADFYTQLYPQADVMASHPDFLLKNIRKTWPEHANSILAANNSRPACHLRIRHKRLSREQFKRQIAPIPARYGAAEDAIILPVGTNVQTLKGFEAGTFYVQNTGTQYLPLMLTDWSGTHLLDACSGVGGKTFHLLDCLGQDCDIDALEPSAAQRALFEANAARLQLHPNKVWPEKLQDFARRHPQPIYDAIVLDAPCSSSGVLAKHPEIKYRCTPRRLQAIRQTQKALLDAAWHLLRPEGILVYMSCSVLEQENDAQMQSFLARHSDAKVSTCAMLPGAIACQYGQQLLPCEGHLGFYYAKIRKTPS